MRTQATIPSIAALALAVVASPAAAAPVWIRFDDLAFQPSGLDARTAGGQPAYVESVQLVWYRRVGLVDVAVAVLDGTTFSPYVSWFNLSLLPATLTVTAWIHPTSYEGNRVLEKGGWRVGGGYGFEFNPFGSLGIRFVVWSGGPATIDSDVAVPLRAWTHIAGTFDGATMRLYVDGIEQSGTRPATMTGNTAPLTVGRASGGDDLFFL